MATKTPGDIMPLVQGPTLSSTVLNDFLVEPQVGKNQVRWGFEEGFPGVEVV